MPHAPTAPLYRRVYHLVADGIAEGRLRPGDRLPAERALCAELGVSRATVRRALAELVEDGLVEASASRGSFVAGGRLTEPPNALLSFTELGAKRGLVATARVISAEVQPATLDEADAFGVAPGSDVLHLRRLRLLDGLPVAVDATRVPLARVPGLAAADFSTASLYDALEQEGAGPVRADYTVEATGADAAHAALLDLEPDTPVLVATTCAYARDDRLIELSTTTYRGDRYRFRATLARRR